MMQSTLSNSSSDPSSEESEGDEAAPTLLEEIKRTAEALEAKVNAFKKISAEAQQAKRMAIEGSQEWNKARRFLSSSSRDSRLLSFLPMRVSDQEGSAQLTEKEKLKLIYLRAALDNPFFIDSSGEKPAAFQIAILIKNKEAIDNEALFQILVNEKLDLEHLPGEVNYTKNKNKMKLASPEERLKILKITWNNIIKTP